MQTNLLELQKTATLIDYIITNSFTGQENLTDIFKTDISDHFPIFTISMKHGLDSNDKKVAIKKENNKCGLDSRTHGYFV